MTEDVPKMLNLHFALRLAAFAVFAACFAFRAGDLPLADEVDFMKPIEAWVSGRPQIAGLWHAPFYPWFLSLAGKVVGFSPAVFRFIGFLTSIGAAIFVYKAARLVLPRLGEWPLTLLWGLTLLAPVTLGSALLLDYDTTLLVVTTAFYFYLLVAHERKALRYPILTFGAVIGLCLMSKETTPLVYPLGFWILETPRRGVARAFARAVLVGIVGVLVFLALTWAWCLWFDLPLSAVFAMDLLGLKVHSAATSTVFLAQIWSKVFPAFWVSLPLMALFVWRLPRLWRLSASIRAITAVVIAVLLIYTFVLRQMTYYFPKYMAPVLVWLPWLVFVSETWPAKAKLMSKTDRVMVGAILIWFLVFCEPLGVLHGRTLRELPGALLPYLVPLAAVYALGLLRRSKALRIEILIYVMALGASLAYCRDVLLTSKAVTYWYGEKALLEARETIGQWRSLNPNGAIYSPAKDIAFVTREFGTKYVAMDPMLGLSEKLCAQRTPLLVVTRVREDNSILKASQMAAYRSCLKLQQKTHIIYGTNSR